MLDLIAFIAFFAGLFIAGVGGLLWTFLNLLRPSSELLAKTAAGGLERCPDSFILGVEASQDKSDLAIEIAVARNARMATFVGLGISLVSGAILLFTHLY